MPPEVLKGNAETNPLIDVWAIGAMFFAMIHGHLPFWGDTEEEFAEKIKKAPLKFDPSIFITADGTNVLKGMLDKEPSNRMNLMDVMQSPYF